MKSMHWAALTLVVVGAVNWGLVGLFDVDLVATLFGPDSALSRAVYVLVGLAGLVVLSTSLSARSAPQLDSPRAM